MIYPTSSKSVMVPSEDCGKIEKFATMNDIVASQLDSAYVQGIVAYSSAVLKYLATTTEYKLILPTVFHGVLSYRFRTLIFHAARLYFMPRA